MGPRFLGGCDRQCAPGRTRTRPYGKGRAGAGPGNTPPAARRRSSERQVVVLFLERVRELLEVAARASLRLVAGPGPVAGLGSRRWRITAVTTAVATSLGTQQDDLAHVDLGHVARLLLLVLVLPILDPPLDVELVTLSHVALDDVREPGAALPLVPGNALVPLGLFLLLARRRIPLAARGERELRHLVASARRPDLGIVPEIPDQRDLVQAAAHISS